jgi:hypothetical protein
VSRTYPERKCFVCGRRVSVNGLAWTNHAKKHVREGKLIAEKPMAKFGDYHVVYSRPKAVS